MEPLNKGKQIEDSSIGMATILLHTKHSEHKPGTDIDKLFLPVHPIVVFLAMMNLKRMVSTSTVALAFKNEKKIMSMVGGLERVTYRFYLIAKEVEQIIFSMKLNGMLHHLIFWFCELLYVMCFILIKVFIWFY